MVKPKLSNVPEVKHVNLDLENKSGLIFQRSGYMHLPLKQTVT